FLFITGTIWHVISDLRAAHYLIAIASLGSFLFILNILFSMGQIVPFINPEEAFDAAFNMDTLVLLISGMLFVGNAWELITEKIQRGQLLQGRKK
ncbi:MAG: hypothetical protein Q7R79_04105, partial [bacterium]|nr:hypothetical protein [bacterium]